MGKVILDLSMSLDGIVAVPDDYRLHDWYFNGSNTEIVDELIQTTGAIIMGRRTYDIALQFDGFADNPYKVPHFVISHSVPEKTSPGTTFIFISDGIVSAMNRAKTAAGEKNVVVSGGANVAQQFLNAVLLDEIHTHLVPLLFGKGIRLFDHLETAPVELERVKVIEAPGVTHLYFRTFR